MALDFCIDIGEEEATRSVPVFSLEQRMHSQLFLRTDELRQLPQLGRMSSFYEDVSYEHTSLVTLLQELQQVIPSWTGRPQMQEALRQLEKICQTAISQKKGVYGFCD
jgi:hypothetical protein